MRKNLFLSALLWFGASTLLGQDPVKVDPKHYKLDFENSQVRVLRITYGPHEKSVMHEHPRGRGRFPNRPKRQIHTRGWEERGTRREGWRGPLASCGETLA